MSDGWKCAFLCGFFLWVGLLLGCFVAVGTSNKVIKLYAENHRLYWDNNKVYEIKEVE